MTEIKLKPCPFCGGEAEIWEDTDTNEVQPLNEETTLSVWCSSCYCRPFWCRIQALRYRRDREEILRNSKQKLIEEWNRRTDNETD